MQFKPEVVPPFETFGARVRLWPVRGLALPLLQPRQLDQQPQGS
jgi:hypothetical protein